MANDSREVYIYVLSESDTGRIRYVGSTVDPEGRLKGHLSSPTSVTMAEWIGSVLVRGAVVDMRVIDTVDPARDAAAIERRWIRRVGRRLPILNGTGHAHRARRRITPIRNNTETARLVRIILGLSPEMLADLDHAAERTGMDRTNIIRAAILEWLDRHRRWVAPAPVPDD